MTHLHEVGVLHHALVVAVARHDVEEAGQPLLLDQKALLHMMQTPCDVRVRAHRDLRLLRSAAL